MASDHRIQRTHSRATPLAEGRKRRAGLVVKPRQRPLLQLPWVVALWVMLAGASSCIPAGADSRGINGTVAPKPSPVDVVQAELFFIPWSTETRSSLSPSDVREHPEVTFTVTEPQCLEHLMIWLKLGDLAKSRSGDAPGDARLVIDIRDSHGILLPFYADQFSLISEDASLRRPIDQRFRDTVGTKMFLGRDPWCGSLR